MRVEFVPVRWWQVVTFLRSMFKATQGHDPEIDRILAHPWKLSSLLEFAFILYHFFSDAATYFAIVDGKRVGVGWMMQQEEVMFVYAVGLLPHFRRLGNGLMVARVIIKAMHFIQDYAKSKNCIALAGGMAATNEPIHRAFKMLDAKPLGMANTTLILSSPGFNRSPTETISVKQIERAEAVEKWKKWRLYVVEYVAGNAGVEVARSLLNLVWMYRGTYLLLYENDQEIGFALARRQAKELEVELFPSQSFWSGPATADVLGALEAHLDSSIRRLTIAQIHADMLETSAVFDFGRDRETERHSMFAMLDDGEQGGF